MTGTDIAISVIIPTYCGGAILKQCLAALTRQECERSYEVLCIDSGCSENDLTVMRDYGVRIHSIDKRSFNHGQTRDLGAELALGDVLVYMNQDAVAADQHWLQNITTPFFTESPPAAVQGAMLEREDGTAPIRPFFWGTCGPRFYFTREVRHWLSHHPGPSLSTVSLALHREAWESLPFGWAPFMEDKKWQKCAMERGLRIIAAPTAKVFHSHNYTIRSLMNRCQNEGLGWRLLGERYTFGDMLSDFWVPTMWRELVLGLWCRRLKMSAAEILFPWLRPIFVWYGNRWLGDIKQD